MSNGKTFLFRTVVVPDPFPRRFSYDTPALFLGSCFTASIGQWLERLKFPVEVNPSGVLYNPFSVLQTLARLLESRPYGPEDLIREGGKWLSLMHDTSFSGSDRDKVLQMINESFRKAAEQLQKLDFLFLTFGTARVYLRAEDGSVVANCHKLPAERFRRKLLSPGEIMEAWRELLSRLFRLRPQLQVFFTVSPIRHWKDGAVGNQLSKSVLHVAIHQLEEEDERVHYFPAYEIVMDELRDYRFYAADMLHLSETAIKYLRERFRETAIDPFGWKVMQEVEKLRKALEHLPRHPDSPEHKAFRETQRKKIQRLEEKYPFLDLAEERKFFEK